MRVLFQMTSLIAIALLCGECFASFTYNGANEGVRLDQKDGGLYKVSFNNVGDKHVDFLLPEESKIEISDQAYRIKLWYAIQEGGFELSFLLRNEVGETTVIPVSRESIVQPAFFSWDVSLSDNWALWTKAESVSLRSYGGSRERDTVSAGHGDRIKSTFSGSSLVGIRIKSGSSEWGLSRSDKAAISKGSGEVIFTFPVIDIRDGFEAIQYGLIPELARWARDEPMNIFLDDMVFDHEVGRFAGPINYKVRVFSGYQGVLVWTQSGQGIINPKYPDGLWDSSITLPDLPVGKYFIQTDAFTAEQHYLESRVYQWIVGQSVAEPISAISDTLSLKTGEKANVYPSDTQTAVLSVSALHMTDGEWFDLEIRDYTEKVIFKHRMPALDRRQFDIPVVAGTDYFATLKLLNDGSGTVVRDVALLHFGVENFASAKKQAIRRLGIDELLGDKNEPHIEYWSREHANQRYPWYSNIDVEDMKRWSDQVKLYGWDSLAVRTIWTDMELLPGVTRYTQIDEVVEHIKKNGQKVMLGSSMWGNRGEVPWNDWMPARDQFGEFSLGIPQSSAWDPSSREGKNKFLERLASHYQNNSAVVGYHVPGAILKSSGKHEDTRLYYSTYDEEAYSKWAEDFGLPVRPLARLHTVPGKRLSKVAPDLSEEWFNATKFFAHTNTSVVSDYFTSIRLVDKEIPVIVDRRPFPWAAEELLPLLAKDGAAAMKNEGSPRFADVLLRTMAVQAGVQYLGELHRHVPTSKALSDVVYFWESLWANYGSWIQRWRFDQFQNDWVSGKQALREDVPSVLSYMKEAQPNWNHLMSLSYEKPDVLVFGSRASENLGGARRGFFADIAGLDTFTSLFRIHQVPVFAGSEHTNWIDLEEFKLVFAQGEILTESAIAKLTAYAISGGKLVLVGKVGIHVAGQRKATAPLNESLGSLPNVKTIALPSVPQDVPGHSWDAPKKFDDSAIEAILEWASVKRPATVTSSIRPGFEVATRSSVDKNKRFIGVMRGWNGWYRDNIEKQDVLRKKFGLARGTVTLTDLRDGRWSVQKFHREKQVVAIEYVENGYLSFDAGDAEAGEVQLYELNWLGK